MIPAHLIVGEPTARATAYVLHGVLGAGHNFRSFVKRLTARRPEWRFVLVDLRHHGHSQGAPPPNTLEACVGDLLDLSRELRTAPEAVIGHSFGGKVALTYGRALAGGDETLARGDVEAARASLQQLWALDSNPGPQAPSPDHEVLRVVSTLRVLPGPFGTRDEAVRGLEERGLSSGLAQWLVTNLERRGDRFAWRFELPAIDDLLDDYFRQDLWPYLDAARGVPEHHLVVAERSDRWTGSMRDRVRTLSPAASVVLHELPNAGHWVHVDNPEGLLDIIAGHLSPPRG